MSPLLPFVLLLAAAARARADEPDPAQVRAFRETAERFQARMGEFVADARALVDLTEQTQRARLRNTYESAAATSEAKEGELRRQTIEKIEAFIKKYPSHETTAEMEYRLADLYFEESELDFFARMETFSSQPADATDVPEPPLKDYARSVGLYRDILARFPDSPLAVNTYYMLGWCLGSTNARDFSPEGARDAYLAIAERFPKTDAANDANMRLGEYYFDAPAPKEDPTANVRTAVRYYEAVLADGPTGRNYDESIYKLGWSHYKLNDYDRALAFLVQLLDYSDQQLVQSGKMSAMRPEAVEYLAISYADIADRGGKRPIDVAAAHLAKVGERKWQHDVFARLGDVLLLQARFDAAIDTWRFLQQKWPLDPENPTYQDKIATTYLTMPVPDPAAAAKAYADLAAAYGEGTPWYNANKSNPSAIARARDFIRGTLGDAAKTYLTNAQATNNPADYAMAAARLKEFTDNFPFADDYDEYVWLQAYALFNAKKYDEAEPVFEQVVRNTKSANRDKARYFRMKNAEARVVERYGKVDVLPPDAQIDRTLQTPGGKTLNVYRIDDAHMAFMQTAEEVGGAEFSDPDVVKVVDQIRPALAYLPGQILYAFGHYDEARQRFDAVIQRYPASDEALFAASLYVATYVNEGDLAKVQGYSSKFKSMELGSQAARIARQGEFASTEEQAAFALAYTYIEKGDRPKAIEAYQAFMKEFPQSKYYKDALYNTANSLDLVGRADDAVKLFEQYIQKYPIDERSKALYLRLAGTYAAILDLDKAVSYYDAVARLFPDYVDAPVAVFNAAFLRVGKGDHQGAAKAFERYATTWPNQGDAEPVYWRAGDQWALVGDNEALDFYQRYLKRYPNGDPNHVIEAHYQSALAYQKRGNARAAQEWAQIQAVFRANAGGNTLSARSRGLAAEGALGDLVAQFDKFKTYKYGSNDKANAQLVRFQKSDELKALNEAAVRLIADYQDFDTATASLYVQGMSYFAYADMLYNVPLPKNLSPEETDIYQAALDQIRLPTEDRGKSRLESALEKARAEKKWSSWTSKALEALHDRYPQSYPSERRETRGVVSEPAVEFAAPSSGEGR